MHDVLWPYGRRDMYYLPQTIPSEYRHPYAKRSIAQGTSELLKDADILNNALYEGGPKNGVLTAIEDFLEIYKAEYHFFILKIQFGLGILVKKGAQTSDCAEILGLSLGHLLVDLKKQHNKKEE